MLEQASAVVSILRIRHVERGRDRERERKSKRGWRRPRPKDRTVWPSINKLIIIIVAFNEFNACTSVATTAKTTASTHNGGHDTLIMGKMASQLASTAAALYYLLTSYVFAVNIGQLNQASAQP